MEFSDLKENTNTAHSVAQDQRCCKTRSSDGVGSTDTRLLGWDVRSLNRRKCLTSSEMHIILRVEMGNSKISSHRLMFQFLGGVRVAPSSPVLVTRDIEGNFPSPAILHHRPFLQSRQDSIHFLTATTRKRHHATDSKCG